jgi:oxaloacetate decarboxylase beta subunit
VLDWALAAALRKNSGWGSIRLASALGSALETFLSIRPLARFPGLGYFKVNKEYKTMQDVFIGFTSITWKMLLMYGIGGILIWLAVKKEYEPMLLLPIGFGAILVNLPLSVVWEHEGASGFLKILYDGGIANELFPILIFIAVGAMIDFAPLFKNPMMIFFGAAAQLGIFATMLLATFLGFDLKTAASIGIIGAADGPTAIYVANKFARDYLGPISVAAYSYMSLVPLIQPPVIRALTTRKERTIHMALHESSAPKWLKILFPIVVTMIAGFVSPMSVPLVGSLMFGNLIRESGVLERLSQTAQNELAYLVTLLLGITIGSSMTADKFLNYQTLLILGMGLLAFVFDTAGGVLFAKLVNLFLPKEKKINPMIGACGISAFPMSARVIQKMANEDEKGNIILMQAISANVSGQLGSIIAGGMVLALVPLLVG